MKNIYLFSLLCVFLTIACSKDEHPCDERGLTKEITDLVPPAILDSIEKYNFEIYGGMNPPDITGSYLANPFVLEASNVPGDFVGRTLADYKVTFDNVDLSNLELSLTYENGPERGIGIGSYIVGEGNRFSVFLKVDVEHTSGYKAEAVTVISGVKTNLGIADFRTAVFVIEDFGDPGNYFIEIGQGRIVVDGDGLAHAI